ncbi:hypothetical protein GLP37_20555 [Photobacterium phosphoreum]|uniref:hypothetical protein n=1 Tax=Photobacterium phosphoreum TaxID=659 RepID=UPI001E4F90D9|nr:hypothetical protein [Photobacterium phosphoreum]MCD9504558.1 hypothetical protein [Photobacterium phosphoreum]
MDILTWFLIIGVAYWVYNKNSTEKKIETKIRRVSRQSTHDGEVEIEQTETYRSTQSTFNHRYEPKWVDSQQQSTQSFVKKQYLNTVKSSPRPKIKAPEIKKNTYNNIPQDIKTTKGCLNCQKIKPLSSFRCSSKNLDGYTKWCSNCLSVSDPEEKYKICPHCKKRRLKSSFRKNSNTSDGLTKWCKNCM